MRLKLVYWHRDAALGEAWGRDFADLPDVEVLRGDLCAVECDAVVSPANSFGFMDGGLDLALSERFGWDVQRRLRERILARPLRELLVGEALVVPTGDATVPWLISAPTMRVPMNVETSVNAYLAMKALLSAALAHSPPIGTVAVPGLGTGTGGIDPSIASAQMRAAYDEVVLRRHRDPERFVEAQAMQRKLNPWGRLYK